MKQVKRAVQEQNGQLIVVQMGDENPKYPVVTDGVIQVDVLESIGRSEEWLLDNLSKQGHDNVANIFIAEYDKGAVTVVTYEKEKPGVLYSSKNFKPRQRRLTVRMLPTSSVLSATSKLYFEQPTASFLVCSLIFIEYYSSLLFDFH
ncbi:putative membrane protein yetF [Streptococcus pneumoniae]|nr:putative membrane protein yetF [Streptococcus pneumoniae]